jgi:hypothetical protein
MAMIAARALDLRAEFEAQLRAIGRLQEQLRKGAEGRDDGGGMLETVLREELAEMLLNNRNIRDLLDQLEAETQPSAAS